MEQTVTKRLINVRVTHEEDKLLARYAAATGRTRTEIIREFIRALKHDVRRQL